MQSIRKLRTFIEVVCTIVAFLIVGVLYWAYRDCVAYPYFCTVRRVQLYLFNRALAQCYIASDRGDADALAWYTTKARYWHTIMRLSLRRYYGLPYDYEAPDYSHDYNTKH